MQVHQPGSYNTRGAKLQVDDWSWRRTRRRLGTLYRLARPYKARTAVAVVALIGATAAALVPPYLVGRAVDEVQAGNTSTLVWIVAVFVAAGVLGVGFSYVQSYSTGWVGERMLADLRNQLFRHLQRLSLGFYERNRAGVIISRLTNDVEALDQLVTDGVTIARPEHAHARRLDGVLFFLDWRLALATLAILPPMALATLWFRKHCGRAYRRVRETLGARDGDARRGHLRHARAAGVHARARQRASTSASQRPLPRREHADGRPERPLLPVRRLPLGDRDGDRARLRRLARLQRRHCRSGRSSRSSATCRTSSTRCSSSRSSTTRSSPRSPRSTRSPTSSTRSPRCSTAGRRATCRGSRATSASTTCASPTAAAPRCCTASTSTSPPGTTVALVGHTGAGKSTIAKLLARFYDPTDGPDHDRRRRPARRDAGVAAPPARDRAAGGLSLRRHPRREHRASAVPTRPDDDIVAAATRGRRATSSSPRLEDGYETQLGERGSRLSLGQRQLVAFARALLADPRILILDEATSSVDIGTERKIERALRRLLAGRTAFIIAHRLSTIRDADLIVVLEHGQVVEQGTHDELIARRGPLHRRSTATGRDARRSTLGSVQVGDPIGEAGRSTSASGGTSCRSRSSRYLVIVADRTVLALVARRRRRRSPARSLLSSVGLPGCRARSSRRSPTSATARRPARSARRSGASAATSARWSAPALLAGARRSASGSSCSIVPGLVCSRSGGRCIVPAIVLEKRGAIESFGRSRELVRGHGWTVFGVILVSFVIEFVAASSSRPSSRGCPAISRSGGADASSNTLITPFVAAALDAHVLPLHGAADEPSAYPPALAATRVRVALDRRPRSASSSRSRRRPSARRA